MFSCLLFFYLWENLIFFRQWWKSKNLLVFTKYKTGMVFVFVLRKFLFRMQKMICVLSRWYFIRLGQTHKHTFHILIIKWKETWHCIMHMVIAARVHLCQKYYEICMKMPYIFWHVMNNSKIYGIGLFIMQRIIRGNEVHLESWILKKVDQDVLLTTKVLVNK